MQQTILTGALIMAFSTGCISQTKAQALDYYCNIPKDIQSDPKKIQAYLDKWVHNDEVEIKIAHMLTDELIVYVQANGHDPKTCGIVNAFEKISKSN